MEEKGAVAYDKGKKKFFFDKVFGEKAFFHL